jgi:hypothetical protein
MTHEMFLTDEARRHFTKPPGFAKAAGEEIAGFRVPFGERR